MRTSGASTHAAAVHPMAIAALLLLAPAVAGAAGGGGPPFQLLWGGAGSGPGQFSQPMDVVVSAAGAVYVTDNLNDRVEQFTMAGAFLRAWGGTGTAPGQFRGPTGVALDDSGNVYVVDQLNARVEAFTPDGVFVRAFGNIGGPALHLATGVAVGPNHHVYVVDSGDHAIVEYDAAGVFVKAWGTFGTGPGQFDAPKGIAVGPDSSIWVADYLNSRVQRFAPDASELPGFSVLVPAGEYGDPWGIAVTPAGNVICSLQGNDKIREYSSAGAVLATWGGAGMTDGLFLSPTGISLDPAGNVYVVDSGGNRVQRFGTVALSVPRAPEVAAGGLHASPNPTRGPVRFSITGGGGVPAIDILDAGGRCVRHLAATSTGSTAWDGRDVRGAPVAEGIYFAVTPGGPGRQVRPIVLLR
jgi:DNA-binding beta-propeller fold protein YncE